MRANTELEIHAAAGVSWGIEAELPALRELVREACGQSIRRVNRLIQLALIGAAEEVPGAVPERCGRVGRAGLALRRDDDLAHSDRSSSSGVERPV